MCFQAYTENLIGGGSVINNNWILTAAHIFHDWRPLKDFDTRFLLTFGEIKQKIIECFFYEMQ